MKDLQFNTVTASVSFTVMADCQAEAENAVHECLTALLPTTIEDCITEASFEIAKPGHLEFLRDALKRAYEAMPVTANPQEFMDHHGNWGLTEAEYCTALILADALTSRRFTEGK